MPETRNSPATPRPAPWRSVFAAVALLLTHAPVAALAQTISGPAPGLDADIRGPRGPVEIANPWLVAAIIGGVLLAALLAWLLWRLRRKGTLEEQERISPYERAIEQLRAVREQLEADPHGQDEKAFVITVSDILRRYIEDQFNLPAPGRTTEEFLPLAFTDPLMEGELSQQLEQFLQRCDLVKFARFPLEQGEMQALLETATTFVEVSHHKHCEHLAVQEQQKRDGDLDELEERLGLAQLRNEGNGGKANGKTGGKTSATGEPNQGGSGRDSDRLAQARAESLSRLDPKCRNGSLTPPAQPFNAHAANTPTGDAGQKTAIEKQNPPSKK